MFEAAELGHKIPKQEFKALENDLRIELMQLQQQLRQADFPVIVVISGVDGAGKNETVNVLNEWMDPRWIESHAYGPPSDEERDRPRFWRYWRDLPPKGKIGLFISSWYHRPFLSRALGDIDDAQMDWELDRIKAFEEMLTKDGALIVKFWLHLSKKEQHKRFKKLESDPMTRWQVTETDWKHFNQYQDFIDSAEHLIRYTSNNTSEWHVVEGVDHRYRTVIVLNTLKDAIRQQLEKRANHRQQEEAPIAPSEPLQALVEQPSILSSLDMTKSLDKDDYKIQLETQRGRLATLHRQAKELNINTVLVFEGWDAGGKGGAIRRITSALNARDYKVIPIAAPTEEERAQHYLWRFWRHLSRQGKVIAYDRSWYGRVLVERVEGFASTDEWSRAYSEINHFEEQIAEANTVICKFWLHITPEEQLKRFEARSKIEYKKWKLTDEDWRNRDKWPAYEEAVNEMVEKTSTKIAPWTLVEANCKQYARIKIITTVCDALEHAIQAKQEQP